MRRSRVVAAGRAAAALVFAALATATAAQEADEAASPRSSVEEITVRATRPDAAVSGGLVPEVGYDEAAITAFGASSLEELLDELAPEVSSGRGGGDGRPAYLVNGRRIANFREIRGYPPEAIERIEVYPEEVALRHGFRPDQKVVNIVLKETFQALELQAEGRAPRSGGGESFEGEIERLRLLGPQRLNLELEVRADRPIRESQREIVVATRGAPFAVEGNLRAPDGGELDPALSALAGTTVTDATLPTAGDGPLTLAALLPTANDPAITDVRPFRTLRPEVRSLDLAGSVRQPFGETVAATLTGTLALERRVAELGLPGYALPVPADDPFSPFADTVELNRLDPEIGRAHV